MMKNLALIIAASILSAVTSAAVEAVQAPGRADYGAATLSISKPTAVTEVAKAKFTISKSESTGAYEDFMAESRDSMRYLALLDLVEMRHACRHESKIKAKLPRIDEMCLALQHYEVLRSSAIALQTASESCDSINLTSVQCAIKNIESFKAISSNYEQQVLVWDRLQIILGTGALRE